MMYHFVNGEQKNNQLELEFIKYSSEDAPKLLNFVSKFPEMVFEKIKEAEPWNYNIVSKITINL